MKKLLVFLGLFLSLSCYSQDHTKNATVVKDTIINKVSYKLYVGAKGGRFIIVTSKTGSTYKKYFKK